MTKSKGIKRPDWKWTAEQDQLLMATYESTRKSELAKAIGCTEGQLMNRGKKLGLSTPPGVFLVGSKKGAETLVKLKERMRKAADEGRIKPPMRHTIDAGLAAAQKPEARARRAAKAADTMRGIPQRMDGLSAAAEHNARAKTYTVLDPHGTAFTFKNLNHFVRENPHLFLPEDTVWTGPENNPWCRAQRGLGSLFKTRPRFTWKGWSAVNKRA
jgi:hypothetical protein